MRAAVVGLALLAVAGCGSAKDRSRPAERPPLTQPEAEQLVMEVPEVAAWAKAIEGRRFGRGVAVCQAEHTPSGAPVDGRRVWVLSFGELRGGKLVVWTRFEVDAATGDIRVSAGPAGHAYEPLVEWRKRLAMESGRAFPDE